MLTKISSRYIMGEDSSELDRIQGVHESTVDYMGKLYLAPVDLTRSPRILDSGTAGGFWLKDLKKKYGAQFELVGTDITASFFPNERDAEGIKFKVQDVTMPPPRNWAGQFDFVHQRFVLGGVRKVMLEDAVRNLISLVKPGGWIELMESDVSEERAVNDTKNAAAPVWNLLRHLYLAMGVEPDPDAYLRRLFEEAGLVNISEERITIPAGSGRANSTMGLKSARTIAVTAEHLVMGAKQIGVQTFSEDDLDELPAKAYQSLLDQGGAFKIYAIWAQKPPQGSWSTHSTLRRGTSLQHKI